MSTTNRQVRILSPLFALFMLTALFGLLLGMPKPAAASCGGTTVVGNEAQLSAAITDFNSQAGPCNFTIQLSADILLTTDLPNINNTNADVNLTIIGLNFAIDGDGIIFNILKINFGTTVTLNSLVVQGSDNHGILNFGNLTIRNSTIRDNEGAGITEDGTSLLITGSTFSGNYQGIYSFGDELTLINTTIANNQYIGVAIEFETVAILTNVTIIGNVAGVVNWGTTTVNNSLFAENEFDDCFRSEGTITFHYSLLEKTGISACDLAAANPDANGNIVGEDAIVGVLGNYGGPTQTAPLLSVSGGVVVTSPGVDDGSNALAVDESSVALVVDQRGLGFPRIVNSIVDMGAVEGPQSFVCPAFPVTVNNETELNTAILCYNLSTTPSLYLINVGADIDLTTSTTPIDNDIVGISLLIEGNDFTIDAQNLPDTRPIQVNEETDVTITELTLTGGNVGFGSADSNGAGILNFGNLTLNDVTVTEGTTENDAGGIYNGLVGTMIINDSIISNNTAFAPDGDGSGITNAGVIEINRSTISGNQTFGIGGVYGGGIFNEGQLTIRDSTIDNNSVSGELDGIFGGGIANDADLYIINSTISNNTAEGEVVVYGGGVSSLADEFDVFESGFNARLMIVNSTISGNSATAGDEVYGGGLWATDFFYSCCYEVDIEFTLINNTISNNSVTATEVDADEFAGGGAAFIASNPVFTDTEVNISNSILANSTTNGVPGGDCFELDSDFDSANTLYEDTDDGACGLPAANPDGNGNIVGQDPALGALGNNGGPTLTHLPGGGSLAIDNGDNPLAQDGLGNPLTADQRGFTPRIFNGTVDMGSVEVGASGPAVGYCPVDPNVGNLLTEAIGTGQGSPTKGLRTRKLVIPNADDMVSLYGQLAALDVGVMKYVRFLPQGYPKIQIHAPTSPAYRTYAVDWWGSELPTDVDWVKGQFFWGAKANKAPRAFVLWPTYNTTETYANSWVLFDESSENHVAWEPLFIPIQVQTLEIPATQADGADIEVTVALVDVNKDGRSVIVTVEAGGVSEQRIITVPNKKDLLNLEEFVLEDVPAGTDEITITLESPVPGIEFPAGGDSMAMIGAAANYACESAAP